MKYQISMSRTGYGHATFEVEAENEEKAREIAQDTAGDYSYNEHDADYELDGIRALPIPMSKAEINKLFT